MPGKGKFSREEGFLGGLYLRENGAWKAFGASVLNKVEFLTKLHFKKSRREKSPKQKVPGRITVVFSTLIRLRICVFTQLKWLKKQLKFTGSRNKKQLKSLIPNRRKSRAYRVSSLLGSR